MRKLSGFREGVLRPIGDHPAKLFDGHAHGRAVSRTVEQDGLDVIGGQEMQVAFPAEALAAHHVQIAARAIRRRIRRRRPARRYRTSDRTWSPVRLPAAAARAGSGRTTSTRMAVGKSALCLSATDRRSLQP